MNLIIGIVVVIACVLGGFAAHGGHILSLWQPFEVVIIGGAAIGGFIIANPKRIITKTLKSIPGIAKGPKYSADHYLAVFGLLFELFTKGRREGVIGLEREIEDPAGSAIFAKYPLVAGDHHLREFLQDYLRLLISGDVTAFQLENLIDVELATHHHEAGEPASALGRIADALPGFGIVAAVLGIVNTMGALGGPVEEIGSKVAAALVGTFLGILLAYGFVGPMSVAIEHRARDEAQLFATIKACLLAHVSGYAPPVAIEFGRKATPSSLRPSFQQLEQYLKAQKG